jgi:hypothetical protein
MKSTGLAPPDLLGWHKTCDKNLVNEEIQVLRKGVSPTQRTGPRLLEPAQLSYDSTWTSFLEYCSGGVRPGDSVEVMEVVPEQDQ